MEVMHRRIKGLLSLTMAVVLVTAAAVPVSADEPLETEQLAQEQLVAEGAETQMIAETVEGEQPTQIQSVAEIVEVETQAPEQDIVEPISVQLTEEQMPVEVAVVEAEAETEPVEQNVMELEPLMDAAADLDDLYNNLTADQKMFEIYLGTHPLAELLIDSDAFTKLAELVGGGVVPDSGSLNTEAETIINEILDSRTGDLQFYAWTAWNVWKVDNDGKPQSIIDTQAYLSIAATAENFKKSAYLSKSGPGTASIYSCKKPILEPIWTCIDYHIPVYYANGTATGETFTINAENYNSGMLFPNIEAVYWKLIYDGAEYRLNDVSEIWTNETNGIRKVGRDFDYFSKAKLQAVSQAGNAEFAQPDWYVGQPKPNAIVSSITNGTEYITYYYKEQGADDSTYTTVVPEQAGAYTAKAVFAAQGDYNIIVKTADFHILPIQVVLQEGTAEFVHPNWYEGQPKPNAVVSSPTNGIENITYYYKEQGADDSAYAAVVPTAVGKYTAMAVFAATELYLEVIKTSDFEILQNIVIEVDGTAPIISGVSDGVTYYGDQKVKVTDANLITVTVNGMAVEVLKNEAEFTLKPSEDVYKIAAEDAAGNRIECTVEVWETWVRDGISANGKKKLHSARFYKLTGGQWTVEGDSTVYKGGISFYVKTGGEYDFKRR